MGIRGLMDQAAVTAALEESDTLAEVFVRAKKSCRPTTEKVQMIRLGENYGCQNPKPKRQRKNSKYCKICKKYGHWTNDCYTTKARELYNKVKKCVSKFGANRLESCKQSTNSNVR